MERFQLVDKCNIINLDLKLTKKKLAGVFLILLIMVLCEMGGTSTLATGIFVCASICLSVCNVRCSSKVAAFFHIVWFLGAGLVIFYSSQLTLNNGIQNISFFCICLNVLICAIVFLIFYTISFHIRFTIVTSALLLMGLTLANYYVYKFRGNEITLTDFKAIATAMTVADRYDYSFDSAFVYGILLAVLYVFSIFCIPKWEMKRTKLKTTISALCCTLSILILGLCLPKIEVRDFAQYGTIYNGFFLNFVCRMKSVDVEEPDDYGNEIIKDLEKHYLQKINTDVRSKPNVIVIMNETFADLDVLGNINTNQEITPFFDSMYENTIRGYALCSVFGGGTCNSEFEVLTGNSMGLLPQGAYPYQQYIKDNTWNMATFFEHLGYLTIATHPQISSNWMRSTVYPFFGFDEEYFIEDYSKDQMLRENISDQGMYEQIISWYEQKEDNTPMFLFGVTMQNHSPFDDENFENTIEVEGFSQEYSDVEQYFSLLAYSDQALEYLISYFEQEEEETVLLFFVDHLPKINDAFYQEVMGDTTESLELQMKKYKIPFVIWANYDIEETYVECTSLNYLSNYLYQAAGVPLPSYNLFLADMQEVIPAMNAFGYYSKEKEKFMRYEEAEGIEAKFLKEYEILQYNSLFDYENRSKVFD